jgi:hypothetical protein
MATLIKNGQRGFWLSESTFRVYSFLLLDGSTTNSNATEPRIRDFYKG